MRIALATAALLFAGQLYAQAGTRPVQVIVSGGFSVPTGDFGDVHDMGLHADVSLLVSAFGALRLRPELSYARFKIKEALAGALSVGVGNLVSRSVSDGGVTASASGDLSSLLGGFANLELPLGSDGSIQPFLLAGVGAVSLNTDATSATESLRQTKMSLNFGAGVRFRIGGIGGLIEARLNNVPSDQVKTTFKEARFIPVTFGLVF